MEKETEPQKVEEHLKCVTELDFAATGVCKGRVRGSSMSEAEFLDKYKMWLRKLRIT